MRSKKAFPLLSQWLFAFTFTLTKTKLKVGKESFSFHFTGLKKNWKLTAEMKLKENFIRFPKAVQKKLQMSWNRFWKNILIFMPLRFHANFLNLLNIAATKSRENTEVKLRYSGKNHLKIHPLCFFDIAK